VASNQAGLVQVKIDGFQIEAMGDIQPGRDVFVCLRPEDLTVWGRDDLPASSARNRLRGKIARLILQGVLVHVTIDCGFPVVALITRASAQEMGLQSAQQVTVSFKTSAIHLIPR
jgi:molybdopterin-binding protein